MSASGREGARGLCHYTFRMDPTPARRGSELDGVLDRVRKMSAVGHVANAVKTVDTEREEALRRASTRTEDAGANDELQRVLARRRQVEGVTIIEGSGKRGAEEQHAQSSRAADRSAHAQAARRLSDRASSAPTDASELAAILAERRRRSEVSDMHRDAATTEGETGLATAVEAVRAELDGAAVDDAATTEGDTGLATAGEAVRAELDGAAVDDAATTEGDTGLATAGEAVRAELDGAAVDDAATDVVAEQGASHTDGVEVARAGVDDDEVAVAEAEAGKLEAGRLEADEAASEAASDVAQVEVDSGRPEDAARDETAEPFMPPPSHPPPPPQATAASAEDDAAAAAVDAMEHEYSGALPSHLAFARVLGSFRRAYPQLPCFQGVANHLRLLREWIEVDRERTGRVTADRFRAKAEADVERGMGPPSVEVAMALFDLMDREGKGYVDAYDFLALEVAEHADGGAHSGLLKQHLAYRAHNAMPPPSLPPPPNCAAERIAEEEGGEEGA